MEYKAFVLYEMTKDESRFWFSSSKSVCSLTIFVKQTLLKHTVNTTLILKALVKGLHRSRSIREYLY